MISNEILKVLKYFTTTGDPGINWDKVDVLAILALDRARSLSGTSFIVTSSYRTPEQSEAIGSFKTSAHTEIPCTAFDLLCKTEDGRFDSNKAFKIVPALRLSGFHRIGLNAKNCHIHCDMSSKLPAEVLFIE